MQEGLSTQREETPIPKANNGVPQTDWDQTNKKTLNYQVGLIYSLAATAGWGLFTFTYFTGFVWTETWQSVWIIERKWSSYAKTVELFSMWEQLPGSITNTHTLHTATDHATIPSIDAMTSTAGRSKHSSR